MSHHGYIVVKSLNGYDEEEAEAAPPPVITIRVGETLTFQNNSRWIHIVGSGDKGLLTPPGTSGMTPRKMMEENDSYTTPQWNTPGEYAITCTVHPLMNAKIVVLP
jgi:plastocyanin